MSDAYPPAGGLWHTPAMYQVIGVRKSMQRLLAFLDSAKLALASYTGNVKHYVSIVVIDPSSKAITVAELSRRAELE